jgi:hypothetical protein
MQAEVRRTCVHIRVAQFLVFCVVFCTSLFSFCPFSFGHCIVCPSSYLWLVRFLTSIFYRTLLAFAHFFTCSNKHSTSSNHKDKYEFQVRSRFLTDPRVEQELFTLPENLRSHSCCSIFSFLCSVLYIIVFILSFFGHCDLRILITPLISSNSSYKQQ